MRSVCISGILLFTFVGTSLAGQPGPDGDRLYRQHCARCHEADMPSVFLQSPIQDMPAERVYEALMYYFMQRHAATLTSAEKRAVAEHVSGSDAGSLTPPLEQISDAAFCGTNSQVSGNPLTGATWNGWSLALNNDRFQPAMAAGLTSDQVPELSLKWAFGLPGSSVASLQATVVGGRVLTGECPTGSRKSAATVNTSYPTFCISAMLSSSRSRCAFSIQRCS